MIKTATNDYFERRKYVNESLNKFNDHLYVLQFCKVHDSNSNTINFPSSKCNYYERGGYKHPRYVNDNYKLHLTTIDMLWDTHFSITFVLELFFFFCRTSISQWGVMSDN
jgi:hypothetical protein